MNYLIFLVIVLLLSVVPLLISAWILSKEKKVSYNIQLKKQLKKDRLHILGLFIVANVTFWVVTLIKQG